MTAETTQEAEATIRIRRDDADLLLKVAALYAPRQAGSAELPDDIRNATVRVQGVVTVSEIRLRDRRPMTAGEKLEAVEEACRQRLDAGIIQASVSRFIWGLQDIFNDRAPEATP